MWSVTGWKRSGFGVGGFDCQTRFESESLQHVQFIPEYSKEARADMDVSASASCWYRDFWSGKRKEMSFAGNEIKERVATYRIKMLVQWGDGH